MFKVDKTKLKDKMGRPITQSLFLEVNYSDFAVYTFKDEDYEYEGKIYPSIKRLYLEHEDPHEYDFACTYFLGWNHWLRLCENKIIRKEVDSWREELEIKLRSQAVKGLIDLAVVSESFQSLKYLSEAGWKEKRAGRPSKAEKERQNKVNKRVEEEFSADIVRLRGI